MPVKVLNWPLNGILKICNSMFFSDYQNHPNTLVRSSLLWEYSIDKIDYNLMKVLIVQRVIERGRTEDFYAILNRFGLEGVKEIIKKIPYLSEKDLSFVCTIFDLKKEDLKCFSKKPSQHQRWIS